jgi:hypothetical protein
MKPQRLWIYAQERVKGEGGLCANARKLYQEEQSKKAKRKTRSDFTLLPS